MTSRWFQHMKPRRNPFINDRDVNLLRQNDFMYLLSKQKQIGIQEDSRVTNIRVSPARRGSSLVNIHMRSLQTGAALTASV
jgi:hypothetical protein